VSGAGHETVLVVGSYPPITTASTEAALSAVREAWEQGKATVVASPRPSAAELTARVDGPLAGWHLRGAQRASGATEVVLCAEPGFPVHRRPGPVGVVDSWVTCALLARSLADFGHVTVIENGIRPTDVPGWRLVRERATAVRSHPERRAPDGVRPTATLTDSAEQYRFAAALLAKRVLGPRAPAVARVARGAWGSARRVAGLARGR
jgi:hypothetical protein